jgi:penicillin amidase
LAERAAKWNRRSDPGEEGPTIFSHWFDSLEREVWQDDFSRIPQPWDWPDQFTLVEGLLRDSVQFRFIDNVLTPEKESLSIIMTRAFRKAVPGLQKLEKEGKLPWSRFKDAGIQHLLRLEALSRFHLIAGGGKNIINATNKFSGPSWRMIVHLTDDTEAYGIYPGGQSGNPGSAYYDTFVNDWAIGNYYPLWVMKKNQRNDKRVIGSLHFQSVD